MTTNHLKTGLEPTYKKYISENEQYSK